MTIPRRGRAFDEVRPVLLEREAAPYAEGSCLASFGQTKVLCTASVQEGAPTWRAGRGVGWVTAEYSMLPRATHRRTERERASPRGRTQEIQRLIGRSLRASIDLAALGERTVVLDCDVLVADGGTRTAAITGAAVALHDACDALVESGSLPVSPMREWVAAVSVGIVEGDIRVDLDYAEDSAAEVDLNLVMLASGGLVEVQGTAERGSFTAARLAEMVSVGSRSVEGLFARQRSPGSGAR